jgi:GNAT superfamily N-acetyltransferase
VIYYSDREEEATELHGHITSLSVLRSHRKLGIASRLMDAARKIFCPPHPSWKPFVSPRKTQIVKKYPDLIITFVEPKNVGLKKEVSKLHTWH